MHIAWADADAYATWAGKAIPTEAEWELAARGGLNGAEFAWGDELNPGGRWMANTWQGEFPVHNTVEDGYEATSPVGAYPANGYGLYDMIGNVWEWTSDWYSAHSAIAHECCTAAPILVDEQALSADRRDPARIPRKVMKGGSHLARRTTADATGPPRAWLSPSTPPPATSVPVGPAHARTCLTGPVGSRYRRPGYPGQAEGAIG